KAVYCAIGSEVKSLLKRRKDGIFAALGKNIFEFCLFSRLACYQALLSCYKSGISRAVPLDGSAEGFGNKASAWRSALI
ncbi:MAG: hypothetical protein FWE68_07035, partial [Defluviitaleaceae bacterium]|nr:hypothetical protein [Defluviitaleaceae bacterium]